MIAAVQGPDRKLTAVHRTFLTLDGTRKAPVSTPKLALGSIGAGAVRLARGGAVLGLCEGIEDALSAVQLFDVPVWAAIGSRLDAVWLPETVKQVIIFADADEAGHEAARRAVTAFRDQGREVTVKTAPVGKDWNDALQAKVGAT